MFTLARLIEHGFRSLQKFESLNLDLKQFLWKYLKYAGKEKGKEAEARPERGIAAWCYWAQPSRSAAGEG